MPSRFAAALLACAACATVVEGPPPGPPPFRGVKRLVLVRRVDDPRAPRGRDALDALKETLDARGYETRVVEVGTGEGALRELARLEDAIAARLGTEARPLERRDVVGRDDAAAVARQGADAVAGYHRLLANRLAPLPPPPQLPGALPAPPQSVAEPLRPPSGALSLVAADGSVAWFPWGSEGAELHAGALLNAAEAIEALVAALSGELRDDP